jgi:hypothetical protein
MLADDNMVATYHLHIHQAFHQSIVSAYLVYGSFPTTDRHQSCINADKWMSDVNHIMLSLVFSLPPAV